MGFYQRHLLPRCIDCVCSSPSLSRLRALVVPRAAGELLRVLHPGGRVHFAEHGLADTERARRWQRRLEPAWVPLAGGCHLTRRPPDLLRAAGFEVEWQEGLMGPSTAAWRLVDRLMHGYWGCATAPATRAR
jgi:hypothetical protein